MWRVGLIFCVMIGLGMWQLGCSDSNLTDPEEIGAIGSAGGFLSSDFGASLRIPPLALDHAVLFTLKTSQVSGVPSGWVPLGAAISVTPEKIRFGAQQYAFLSLPFDSHRLPVQRNILDLVVGQWVDQQWKLYPLYALQESMGSVVVWVQETGTFAAFLKPQK